MKAALPKYLHYLLLDDNKEAESTEGTPRHATTVAAANKAANTRRQQQQRQQQQQQQVQQQQQQQVQQPLAATKPTATAASHIPSVVHFVLTDRGTRYFDWTAFVAVIAAARHVRPMKGGVKIHVLDGEAGGAPIGEWWAKLPSTLAALGVPLHIVPFGAADVPAVLNNVKVVIPAHISDFKRFQVSSLQV
jgi:hypothetical protein